MLHELHHLACHALDVVDNQLVQIGVGVLASDAQDFSNRKFAVLLELQNIDVLDDTVSDRPSDSKMVVAPAGRADDSLSGRLRTQVFLGLSRVEGLEKGVLDEDLAGEQAAFEY